MSFILDALKKSESERQRKNGPALFEVKVAPPRSRFGAWAVGLGALLLVNLVVVGWLLLRAPAHQAVASAAPSGPLPVASAHEPIPAQPPPSIQPGIAAGQVAGGASVPPVIPTPAPITQPVNASVPPGSESHNERAPADYADNAGNPDDLAPAVEPPRSPPRHSDGVQHATASGLPTYQDAAAVPGANLPELRLDLHDYASRAEDRFVFLNMTKLREGDSLPQGVRVESITPDGVILSYHGTRFVLLD